ncbi:DASH family cryptochrome [Aquimarina sp. ERC-38]|uniref:DASH family cryptochrome n=1 Tax=Aquimarina sp. ERC-38 TaxID=2949996 RepID=UPI0022451C81|nr:DASH family cryptochrome [Aquimarina sp. ERC-38]UZO82465.1 DASH family cryptochrome [Aquimarina sp. ERC-38]
MSGNTLVWFKNDLRLHDNETLVRAVDLGKPVFCLYCVDPRLFKNDIAGLKKTGSNRYLFLKESLENLSDSLQKKNNQLTVVYAYPENIIPEIVQNFDIQHIFTEQEYAPEEQKVVQKVKSNLPDTLDFEEIWGKTLYHIDDIPFKIQDIPLTSKAYRIPVSKETTVRTPFDIPDEIPSVDREIRFEFPTPEQVGFSAEELDSHKPYLRGGEEHALAQLRYYTFETELLTGYRWTRNRSLGMDYSSKFSPYLAVGALSPRTIYKQIKRYETQVKKNQSTWWLVFELVWRDYFTFKGMKMGNAIFKTEGYRSKELPFTNDRNLFEKWCLGQTGIPFVDAHMRQLNQTGYMSNRGRVNCSSFLVHDYQIDWTWGAAYFEQKLIDYDVTSNWMNWHVQAYEIWYTNPIHQSLKYKAKEYIQKWIPELCQVASNLIYTPWLLEEKTIYPKPVAIYKKWDRSINRILKTVDTLEV